jgi:3-carboxy-cis,cis-muconate cycloisomerase
LSATDSRTLLDGLFTGEKMRALFSDRARLQAMLDFEAALARAQARHGIVPAAAAKTIAAHCQTEFFDFEALSREARPAGNLAIPMVKALTALVARQDRTAADFVHWGSTSQDVIDTGLVLQLRAALRMLESELERLSDSLAAAAKRHGDTLLAGRTLLQQAVPITFALKVAGWLDAVERDRARLNEQQARVSVLQFGGAAGTLAAFGSHGLEVAQTLAEELGLALPALPWHAHRDRVAEAASAVALLTGTLGKIARDVSLLMQSEVGEAFEPTVPGRGGSSAMPHKRNPVGCAVILANAARVPPLVATLLAGLPQEHERGLGGWHAEWETLPQICLLAGGALDHTIEIVDGLQVDAERMRQNLEAANGLVLTEAVAMALAAKLGKPAAQELVEQACHRAARERRPLREVLAEDKVAKQHLPAPELDRLFDPRRYTGAARALVERVLAQRGRKK